MELTTLQKELIYLLKAYGMKQDEVVGVMLILDTEKKLNEMYKWIETHTSASLNEVMEAALQIHRG